MQNNQHQQFIAKYYNTKPGNTAHPKDKQMLPVILFCAFFLSTAFTVFIRICISSARLQFVIYSVSNYSISSKFVILLLPLTCHIPVIPGFVAKRALW